MLVSCFDLESTGVDVEKDRIVEIGWIAQDLHTGVERFRYQGFVNPTISIPKRASAVHGIMDADVMGAKTFAQLAPVIATALRKSVVLVGHNIEDFDVRLLLHEFIRCGVTITGFPLIVDTMKLARWATPDGKLPTLGELAYALDVPYAPDAAHRALYDVAVNIAAWREGLRIGAFTMPEPTEAQAA